MENSSSIRRPELSPAKQFLLQKQLSGELLLNLDVKPFTVSPRPELIPLSSAQQRLWFVDQLEGGRSTEYNLPLAFRLRGELDLGAMRKAINTIVERHESLRTHFVQVHGEPVQAINPHLEIEIAIEDISTLASELRWSRVMEAVEQEGEQPFDLVQGPIFRARILQLGKHDHVFLRTMHHIVTDAWSDGIFNWEFKVLYEAFQQGQENPLRPLDVQYADFAIWQRELLEQGALERGLQFWKQQLAGIPEYLELPTNRPRPAVQTFRAERCCVEVSAGLMTGLQRISHKNQTTLYMTLLAVFGVLLLRYTGQQDIVVGSPIANRQDQQLEKMIGFFVNMLAIRLRVAPGMSFRKLLEEVRRTTLEAYQHQDVPFGRVVEKLLPLRSLGKTPVFQVVFTMQNAPWKPQEIKGLQVERIEGKGLRVRHDLEVYASESQGKVLLHWLYKRDLFERWWMEQMAQHFLKVLEAVVVDDMQAVDRLPMLSGVEREQVLYKWNQTETDYLSEKCIHELFEEQVKKSPEEVAAVFEGKSLSYGQLNRRANQLAHYLLGLGVKPETRVGICVERGLEMIIGLLGVLKAGGAYVPLDPSYPAGRLRYMLEDSKLVALLTQTHLRDLFTEIGEVLPVIDLPAVDHFWPEQPETNLDPVSIGLTAEHLAYVIYTSGSTGQPKGVMVEHRNVARLFAATDKWFGFDEQDVWTFFHSYAFDFSVWEIWGALLYGGRLVVVSKDTARSPEDFYRLVCREKVTILNQTPSAFRQLIVAKVKSKEFHQLRQVIFGGEPLELDTIRPWYENHYDQCTQLTNMYGITETTVHVTYQRLEYADINARVGSPIGCRLPDMRIYILDTYGQPVPVGVAGELYVGGAGVARGYLNRPDLTAERFVADPFAQEGGDRMYRTGDVGRWLPDGNIEFLGRNDSQVKIHGFRIEMGEIEARLREHPEVSEAVVVAREDTPGDRRLVAYYTSGRTDEGDQGISNAERLRRHLAALLPQYMVPAAYVRIVSLPLTLNGKLDWKALPAPEVGAYAVGRYERPIGEAETKLARVWAEVLHVDRVGRHDSFFALGGDSIRAITVIYKAKELGVPLRLVQLFEHQTISTLVAAIWTASSMDQPVDSMQSIPLLSEADQSSLPEDIEEAYVLSYMQMGMVFHNQTSQESGLYHDIFSYHMRIDNWDSGAFSMVLEALAERHSILRTSFSLDRYSEPLQLVHRRIHIPVVFEDLSAADLSVQEEILSEWIEREKRNSFDLSHPPLMRIFIHRRGANTFQYTLSFHHAILDGWSVATFQVELFREYTRVITQDLKTLQFKPLRSTFKRAIAREREALTSQISKSFWSAYMEGCSRPSLPSLKTNGASGFARRFVIAIPPDLRDRLIQIANSLLVPFRILFLSAHLRVMSLLSGEKDVITGLVSHSRPEEPDGENVLGMFINMLPFRQSLRSQTWSDLVLTTYSRQLEIMPHRHYPYAQMFIDNGRIPLFETGFNYIDFHIYEAFRDLRSLEFLAASNFEATDVPLMSNVINKDDETFISLAFDPTRFSIGQIEKLAGYYSLALQSLCLQPSSAYGVQAIITEAERHQILYEWNETASEIPASMLPGLFEQQVERTPDAIALSFEGERLSYKRLNEEANRFAHYLIGRGIGPEDLVALYLERSLEMAVITLGILKSGAAFLSLDPAYPQGRLASILRDATPILVVSTRALQKHLDEELAVFAIDEPDSAAALQRAKSHDPTNRERKFALLPQHPAYVIYTSGSTGQPKGVTVEHRGMLNHLCAKVKDLGLNANDIVAHTATVAFDVAVWQMWAALLVGGQVDIINSELARDGLKLLEILQRSSITVLETVPSMLANLLEAAGAVGWPALRHTLSNGEPLLVETCLRWRELSPIGQLWNLYGPTECSDDITHHRCDGLSLETILAPIGRPILNMRVFVLDEALEPVPVGMPGELYIAGVGLGRGYLNRAALTAERFVANPFGMPGSRMYRSGDLASWRSEGVLEFLGRTDHQVKLRGFRVELGEIESALRQLPEVLDVVVVVREEKDHDKRLVGYVVAAAGAKVDPNQLGQRLGRTLPDYMVPSAIVVLDALPLTLSGKIDRNALPAPEYKSGTEYRGPRTPEEEILCSLFAEVLGLGQVGIDDNFFQLGGHSLIAMRLVSRIRATLGAELPIRTFFEAASVAELSARLSDFGKGRTPLTRQERPESLPLSHAQQRLWFIDQLEGGKSTQYNMPVALRLRGELDLGAMQKAINAIVERQASLRTHFAQIGGKPVLAITPHLEIEMAMEDISTLDSESQWSTVMEAVEREWNQAFDLGRGPIFRARLLKLGKLDHVFLRTMHHIISDEWSEGIFCEEFGVLYEAFQEGRQNPLGRLDIEYADFAIWQRRWLEQGALQEGLKYWKQQLAGGPEDLALPTARTRPEVQAFQAKACYIELTAEQVARLRSLAQENRATVYMTLLAVLGVLLSRYSGQQDVLIGSPVADRHDPQLEDMIGFFVNLLVMRVGVRPGISFRELLEDVRRTAMEAYQHQDVPFDCLVEELSPHRSLGKTPVFQVAFALHNAVRKPPRMKGLQVESIVGQGLRVRHDLEVHAWESQERIHLYWLYKRDLFESTWIEQMVQHYLKVLDAVVADPEQRVEEIDLLAGEERRQILEEWNQTGAVYAQKLVHRLIEEQAAKTPAAIAVDYEGQQLTYAQLNGRANQLAWYLNTLGVKAEVRVGICMERSLEMAVGLLGVLKAGGAYVPLDPGNPEERLRWMMEESQTPVVLIQEKLIREFPRHPARLVNVDAEWQLISQERDENPNVAVDSGNLAYVIYTSGSTGRPKGAMNTHAGLSNRLLWMQEKYQLDVQDRVLQKTPYSFDVSVWEFFWPLMVGAELLIAQPGGHRDPSYLAELIQRKKVSTLHFVPSMLAAFLEAGEEQKCRSLRRIICSGETLGTELASRCTKLIGAELHNLYGPTEASIDVTSWKCEAQAIPGGVAIGTPIANTRIYILDGTGKTVPVLVPGELYIGGLGLGRGYVNRPDLTAESFVPDHISGRVGERLYRTGDKARWRADGNLEYLGRLDNQVKIRGHRIELGEIEERLRQHPSVHGATVTTWEQGSGERRLVAYVVPDEEKAAAVRTLARYRDQGVFARYKMEELPDGQALVVKNSSEVRFLYREIFERDSYAQHNIVLGEGDCIFDVGANIGMFSLYIGQRYKNLKIYAFEPIPELCSLLRMNLALWNIHAEVFGFGLSNTSRMETFTYYPHMTILSGSLANAEEEKRVIVAYELNETGAAEGVDTLQELIEPLLAGERVQCEVKALSQVIRENFIQRIDLLKIDVEKSERKVLEGIDEDHWAMIRQLVVEVHDIDGCLGWTTCLLQTHGYVVAVEEESALQNTGLFVIYAVRSAPPRTAVAAPESGSIYHGWCGPSRLQTALSLYLRQKLPDYMVPSTFVFVDSFPLLANGKLNRKALPLPEFRSREEYREPRTPEEKILCSLVAEILGMERVGLDDNFFDIGGNSITSIQLVSRARKAGFMLIPQDIFQRQTVRNLAAIHCCGVGQISNNQSCLPGDFPGSNHPA